MTCTICRKIITQEENWGSDQNPLCEDCADEMIDLQDENFDDSWSI